MTQVRTVMLLSFCVSLSFSIPATRDEVQALGSQQLNPKAAQQYAADSEKASQGDPEAAFRMGEALESGRLGLKDPRKALTYYRLAAKNGHPQAAKRITEIESALTAKTTPESSPISRDTKR